MAPRHQARLDEATPRIVDFLTHQPLPVGWLWTEWLRRRRHMAYRELFIDSGSRNGLPAAGWAGVDYLQAHARLYHGHLLPSARVL